MHVNETMKKRFGARGNFCAVRIVFCIIDL